MQSIWWRSPSAIWLYPLLLLSHGISQISSFSVCKYKTIQTSFRTLFQMLKCWNNETSNYYNSRTSWTLQATGFVVGVCFIIFINPTLRRSAADRGKWKVWWKLGLLLELHKGRDSRRESNVVVKIFHKQTCCPFSCNSKSNIIICLKALKFNLNCCILLYIYFLRSRQCYSSKSPNTAYLRRRWYC